MRTLSGNQYRLSEHARDRLIERTGISEHYLLELLRRGAFRYLRSNFLPTLPQQEIDFFAAEYGLTFKEMKQYGMVRTTEKYRYVLVWSIVDKRALTLVVAPDERVIITVLYADDFSVHDWSDIVTEEKISFVKNAAERLCSPVIDAYEFQIRWIDVNNAPKVKTFKTPKITSVYPLLPPLEELKKVARSHVGAGRNISIIVRKKSAPSVVLIEESL